MNVSVLEEWVGEMGLPKGVQSHFAPVRDLLNWLQVRNPGRDVVDSWLPLNIMPVSLVYQRLRKPDRNGTNDAKPESPPGMPGCIGSCQDTHNESQMRRAVRDYRYEVNEGRMTEECTQYLAQLQKDWERHRVKLGVEALRKEVRVSFWGASLVVHIPIDGREGPRKSDVS